MACVKALIAENVKKKRLDSEVVCLTLYERCGSRLLIVSEGLYETS